MRENRLSEKGKKLYKLRKERVERSFADSKQNHGYRYAMYKGIKKNQNYTWLICAAQNMKTIAIWLSRKHEDKKKSGNINCILINKFLFFRKFKLFLLLSF